MPILLMDKGFAAISLVTTPPALIKELPMEGNLTNEGLLQMLHELFATQRSAVLATTENGQPYLSLMAFATTSDLQYLLVATYRATRKYRNIEADSRVALLADTVQTSPQIQNNHWPSLHWGEQKRWGLPKTTGS